MQFVDHVKILVESGAGGDGLVSWRREKFVAYGGPAGGDGGHGGTIYLEATNDLHTLLDFQYKSVFKAVDGEKGKVKNQHGKAGDDLVIKVPCGTIVRDADSGEAIADLVEEGDKVMVAIGGRGGRGNSRFTSSRRQAPQFAEPGEPAIRRELLLELKLIADVGIIGLPNAGKSTLISIMSSAKPKIADYPFTTLVPNLGVVRKPSNDGVVIADIPGLIEGASEGIGLGHDFLRHVERTRLLLHLVDISSPETSEPIQAYHTINTELQKYSAKLAQKPQILVLTKQDAVDEETLTQWKSSFEALTDRPVFTISSVAHQGLEPLKNAMFQAVDSLAPDLEIVDVVADVKAFNNDDSQFEISRDNKQVFVDGGKLDRLVRVTDLRNPSAVRRMVNIFKAMGVFQALEKEQVKAGQTIVIGGFAFEYWPEMERRS